MKKITPNYDLEVWELYDHSSTQPPTSLEHFHAPSKHPQNKALWQRLAQLEKHRLNW